MLSQFIDIGESTAPIIPIVIGKDLKTFQVWKELMDAGVYTNPIISMPRERSPPKVFYQRSGFLFMVSHLLNNQNQADLFIFRPYQEAVDFFLTSYCLVLHWKHLKSKIMYRLIEWLQE